MGDVVSLDCEGTYDCVFARGLSLYNTEDLEGARGVTDALLAYLKPNGVMIFDYYTNLCKRRKSESRRIYHSLADVKRHFSLYPELEVYFSLRIVGTPFSGVGHSTFLSRYWLLSLVDIRELEAS